MILRRVAIHRVVEKYRAGRAGFSTCPACGKQFLIVGRISRRTTCNTCSAALDSIGHISIEQAVGLIAARRAANADI